MVPSHLLPNATHIEDRYNPRGVAWIVLRVVGDNGSQSAGVLRCFPLQASEPNGGACRDVSKTHEGVEHVRSTYGARTEHVRSTYGARWEKTMKSVLLPDQRLMDFTSRILELSKVCISWFFPTCSVRAHTCFVRAPYVLRTCSVSRLPVGVESL